MKTKRRALGESSSIRGPLALALPLCLLACSSKSQANNNGGSSSGDAGDVGDGAPQEGGLGAIDPSLNPDPQDLDPSNGDLSLDIAGSQVYFDKGAPWARVVFYGPWPPATTVYSWACSVALGTQNAPVVTYVVQASAGKQTDTVNGMDQAKVTFAAEPRGFRVLLADTTLVFDRYGVECTVQAKDIGKMSQDTSGAFVVTTKVERPFGK